MKQIIRFSNGYFFWNADRPLTAVLADEAGRPIRVHAPKSVDFDEEGFPVRLETAHSIFVKV